MIIHRTSKPPRTVVIAPKGRTNPIAVTIVEEQPTYSREAFVRLMARLIRKGEEIRTQHQNIGAESATQVEYRLSEKTGEKKYDAAG